MKNKKAVAIVVVWSILIMLSILAMAALRLMGNQGTLTESSVRRTAAYYTAKAGVVHALEACRTTGCVSPDTVTLPQVTAAGTMTANINSQTVTASDSDANVCLGCERISVSVTY